MYFEDEYYLKETIMRLIRTIIKKVKWRLKNKHNFTKMNNCFDDSKVTVGKGTYGLLTIQNHSIDNYYCRIGSFCSIADDVVFLVADEHRLDSLSTFPFKVKFKLDNKEALSRGDIKIDDDVWIGQGAIILSGVHAGQGSVIAAGAVVTHDVPPYSIVGGIPAKVIKYRFSDEIISELLKIDFNLIYQEDIIRNIDKFYEGINDVGQLNWLKPYQKRVEE